jgi:hypothetical protein
MDDGAATFRQFAAPHESRADAEGLDADEPELIGLVELGWRVVSIL